MESFLTHIRHFRLGPCEAPLAALIHATRKDLDQARGNFGRYRQVYEQLPDLTPGGVRCDGPVVQVGTASDISSEDQQILMQRLKALCPWRKGPFDLFGIRVDAEWRSDMKWDRISPHLPDLSGLRILDIGSSNGYYMFRMSPSHPLFVLGIEPLSTFYYQYRTLQRYLARAAVFCLPVPFEQMPRLTGWLDLVFCMGILYHRRSPVDLLKDIYDSLDAGGHLVLETLVLEGKNHLCLFPRDRYAKMRNVYFIPDLLTLESFLLRAGFRDIRCLDVTRTRPAEQRKTDWIQTESLTDFLHPDNPDLTIEGYPGPVRAVFVAGK